MIKRLKAILPALESAAAAADEAGRIDPDTWLLLRRTGWLSAGLPLQEGGDGLLEPSNVDALLDLLRALGGADLSLGRLMEGHLNAIALVERYGTGAQRHRVAEAVRDGALLGVWGADGGSPLRLEPGGNAFRLHGGKILASGAGTVTLGLATAATADGPQLVLLRLAPGERADVTGWTAQGMRATATGTIDATAMVVGSDDLIGKPGDFLRQPSFSGGAWRFCAVHLGAAERLLDLFRAHLVARKRDGDPYQLQRVAQGVAATTTAAFWIAAAARRLATHGSESEDPASTVAFANLTRTVTERAALDVLEAVHRGVGLPAFVRPNPIERISRDLGTYLRQPVPDLAMADAARAVLASERTTATLWSTP